MIVVVLPFVVFRLLDADALLPEPHAATEISVAAASTAAAIRLMPFGFLKIAMVMVVFLLSLVLKNYGYSVTGLLGTCQGHEPVCLRG